MSEEFGAICCGKAYTAKTLAGHLNVTERTVRRWVQNEGLPAFQRMRLTLIAGQDFVAWVCSQAERGPEYDASTSCDEACGPDDLGGPLEEPRDGAVDPEVDGTDQPGRGRKGRRRPRGRGDAGQD